MSKVYDAARGRWKGILMGLGMLDSKQLSGKSTACPMCGGTDRFQFDDKDGNGSYFCRQCGNGLGVDLVCKLKGIQYAEACKLIEAQAGVSKFEAPRAARNDDRAKREMAALWARGGLLTGNDPGSRYLASRGVDGSSGPALKVLDALPYNEPGEDSSEWPCLLAKFSAPDGQSATLHRTWITDDGRKAPVFKPRKLMAGPVPAGGAVRLSPVVEKVMGVAEGIETALSAAKMHDIPVWSTLSAGNLIKFEPPDGCLHLLIFADSDDTFTGQYAAYALAHRLAADKKRALTVEVCHTKFRDSGEPDDWNDFLMDSINVR